MKPGEWNTAEMFMDANVVRTFVNDGREHGAVNDGSYGPFALYVGGTGEVRVQEYRDTGTWRRRCGTPDQLLRAIFRKQKRWTLLLLFRGGGGLQ